MMLLSTLLPDVRWQSGNATVGLRAVGRPGGQPRVEGRATVSKGTVLLPWLKNPLTQLTGQVNEGCGCVMLQ